MIKTEIVVRFVNWIKSNLPRFQDQLGALISAYQCLLNTQY